jgi:hypothetical protein
MPNEIISFYFNALFVSGWALVNRFSLRPLLFVFLSFRIYLSQKSISNSPSETTTIIPEA